MRRHGFTLFEILVVVGVIGLIAAVAAPRLLGARAQAVQEAARTHSLLVRQAVSGWLATHPTITALDFLAASGLPPGSLDGAPASLAQALAAAPALYDCGAAAAFGVDGTVGGQPASGYGWAAPPRYVRCVLAAVPDPSGIGSAVLAAAWVRGQPRGFLNGRAR